MTTPPYLDCCGRPELHRLRTLYTASHDLEALEQCAACATYWFYRFHEYGDDLTSWFTPLTDDEGQRLMQAATRDDVDLSFLSTRPSWMDDSDGVSRVDGAPDHPWA